MDVHDRIRMNPPKSVVGMDEHEQYWSLLADITDNGVVLEYQDRVALGELAVSLCEMNRLRQDLKDNGESLELQGDRNIVTKKNPARDALEKLRPSVLRLMKEFKMTPNSRGKTYGPSSGNTADEFDGI